MSDSPLVSVVIPNWNGAHHLRTCLDALNMQTYANREVWVVDNASEDGSQELITADYPDVHLLALTKNRGFTGACNAGIEASTGEIVILLNNDTEVTPDWIAQIVDGFDRNPDAGMVASKMLLFDRRDTLHAAGDYYRIDGLPGNRGVWQPDGPEYGQETFVFSACGGSAAYRREMLDEIGGLADEFFFSCEDVDLGWRAQLAGWKAVFVPDAVVYHHLAATGGGPTASFHDGRNTIWVIARNYPGLLFRRYWRRIVSAQIRRAWEAVKAWRGAAARATLRGILAGIVTLPRVLRQRQEIQASRKVSLEYIESLLVDPDER